MIQETQADASERAHMPMLIWGYTSVLISLIVYGLWQHTHAWQVHFLWWVLPVIGILGNMWCSKGKPKRKKPQNYMTRITTQVWTLLGALAFVFGALAFLINFNILMITGLLISLGVAISGIVLRYKAFIIGGCLGIAGAIALIFVRVEESLLVFALIFAVNTIIPGHILQKDYRRHERA